MDTLVAAFRNKDQIWVAIGAIASALAVIVALLIALIGPWLARKSARRAARNVLPAIGYELLWIAGAAEACIYAARQYLNRGTPQQSGRFVVVEPGPDIRVLDAFARADFPVFAASSVILHNAADDLIEAITTSYGDLYRAKSEFKRIAEHSQDPAAPSAEDLKHYDAAAGIALAAARRAYRYIAATVDLQIPSEWEPGPHVQRDEDLNLWSRLKARIPWRS